MAYSLSHKNIFLAGCNNASGGNFPKNCGSKKEKLELLKHVHCEWRVRDTLHAHVSNYRFFSPLACVDRWFITTTKKGVASRPSTRVTDF